MTPYPYPEVRLSDMSRLTHSFHTVPLVKGERSDALIVKFVGSYGVGSKGNGDADYMRAVAAAGLEAWYPSALVFDFSEMDYIWGDWLSTVLFVGAEKINALEMVMTKQATNLSELKPGDIPTVW